MDDRDGTNEIYYAQALNGVKITNDIRLSDLGANSERPSVLAGSGRQVYFVWQDARDGNWEIYFAKTVYPGDYGTISGTITDAATGLPIQGANVSVSSGNSDPDGSDANGFYEITNVPVGAGYTVTASASNYRTQQVSNVNVDSAQTTTLDFALFLDLKLILLSPAEGAVVTTDEITFTWSDVGAERYELYVDNNPQLSSPEISPYNIPALRNRDTTAYTISGNWLQWGGYSWKVIAYFSQDTIESEIGHFKYEPPTLAEPNWVPLYRLYHPSDKDHFYAALDTHRQVAIKSGFRDERVEGFVSLKRFEHPSMIELFRFYDQKNKAHYYTKDSTDRDQKIAEGLLYEGITSFAYRSPQLCMVPLYHLKKDFSNPPGVDHFYTISAFEKDNAINVFGFSLIDTLAYISPNGAHVPIPYDPSQLIVGEGVNAQNGNLTHYTKTSFAIPSTGLPLVFEHIYNSFSVIFQAEITPLGPGWSHSYNSYLSYCDNGLAVTWPNGRIDIYEKINGQYKPKYKNVYDSLAVISDTHFEIIKKDQTVYSFQRFADAPEGYPAVLQSIRDRNDNTLVCMYAGKDSLRTLKEVISPDGRMLLFTYYDDERQKHLIKQVADPLGRSVHFEYDDSSGNLIRFIDAKSRTTEYAYDEAYPQDHLLAKVKLPRGNVISNAYNERRLNSQTSRFSGSLTVKYEVNVTTITNADLQIDVHNIKVQDFILPDKIVNRLGFTLDPEYTDSRHPTKPEMIIDANNQATAFAYDAKGNILRIQQPKGVMHHFKYDQTNNLIEYTDPRDKTTEYRYDGKGNLIEIIDPLRRSTKITRKSTGLIETITDPMAHTTAYGYNAQGDITEIRDNLGNISNLIYDAAGRALQLANPKNQITRYSYSPSDRLLTATDAAGTTSFDYDANDNLEIITSAKGQQTKLSYNELDLQASIANPLLQQTRFEYDEKGFMKSLTRPNGQRIDFAYDPAGRLETVSFASATFVRDGNGNITLAKDEHGSMSFSYDELNRLKSYTDYFGNLVQYEYDLAGNVVKIIYPGNKAVTYSYNDDNRLNSLTTWNAKNLTYTYNEDGTIEEVAYGNGVRCQYNYDGAGRLTGLITTKPSGEIIASYKLTLDPIGNITSEEHNAPLSIPPVPARNLSLTYDAANRIQTAGGANFSFDPNGNMITKRGKFSHSYTYDVENRLVEIRGANTASYTYDAFGNRRKAVRNGITTQYVLDINGPMSQVLMETDSNNVPTNYYVYGLGLVARIKPDGTTRYYHPDFRGNIIALTDDNAVVTHEYAYGAFGELYDAVENDFNPFRFVGQFGVMDEGNGLYFMRARYYDPEVGRFVSEDPIWEVNLYSYSGNNPLTQVDFSGRSWIKVAKAVIRIGKTLKAGGTITSPIRTGIKVIGAGTGGSFLIKHTKVFRSNIFTITPGKTGGSFLIGQPISLSAIGRGFVKKQIATWIIDEFLDVYAEHVEGSVGEDAPGLFKIIPGLGNVKSAGEVIDEQGNVYVDGRLVGKLPY